VTKQLDVPTAKEGITRYTQARTSGLVFKMSKLLHTHQIVITFMPRSIIHMAIDRPASFGVSQDTCVVHEWLWAGICFEMNGHENTLDVHQVTLERIKEAASLEMLRGGAAMTKHLVTPNSGFEETVSTDMEIPSSLIIYPMPYPSLATGPNPNNLSAGFPQLEVDKIDVDSKAQPGSVKMLGIVCLPLLLEAGSGSSGSGLRFPAISR
jgi:hypothetical protein